MSHDWPFGTVHSRQLGIQTMQLERRIESMDAHAQAHGQIRAVDIKRACSMVRTRHADYWTCVVSASYIALIACERAVATGSASAAVACSPTCVALLSLV